MSQIAFNEAFYLSQNPDVFTAVVNRQTTALAHYNNFGRFEGRNPSQFFSTNDYLLRYSDIRAAGVNPLDHFINFGAREGRFSNSNLDTTVDTNNNDIANEFNGAAYITANPDVGTAGFTAATAYQHYVLFGQFEGRFGYLTGANNAVTPFSGPFVNGGNGGGGNANPGATFALSAGSDVISPTSGSINNGQTTITARPGPANDVFLAESDGLFAAGDVLDGGAGTDSLSARYSLAGATTAVSVGRASNIENVFIRADLDTNGSNAAETSVINTAELTGVTALWADRVNTVGTVAGTLQFDNVNLSTALGVKGGVTNTASNVTFNYTAAQVVGAADVATLNLDGATAGTVTIAGIETLNVASAGSSANTLGALTTANATTVNVTGAQNLTVTGALGATVTTFDASKATGNVSVQLGTTTGNVKASTGTGADTIGLGTLVATSNTQIDGGAGTDTLKLDAASNNIAAQLVNLTNTNVKNIEGLNFGGNIVALDLDAVKFTTSNFTFSEAGTAQAIAITNHSSANTYTLTGGAAVDETSFTITTLKEANSLSNVLNLTLVNSDVGAIDGGQANNTIETMNITSNTGANSVLEGDANTLGTVTVTAGGTINLTGSANTTLTLGAAAILDASAATFTGKLTAIGSTGADTIKGGALADVITGGAGFDTLTGGNGIDTFKISIAGGNGVDRDTITDFKAGNGGDIFNLNSGLATLDGTNNFTSAAALQTQATAGNFTFNGASEVAIITNATIADVTSANSLNGTNLLTALGGTITAATAGDQHLFAIGIAGGGTAIYYGDSNGDTAVVAAELTLVGVLQNVAVGSLTFDNFGNAA